MTTGRISLVNVEWRRITLWIVELIQEEDISWWWHRWNSIYQLWFWCVWFAEPERVWWHMCWKGWWQGRVCWRVCGSVVQEAKGKAQWCQCCAVIGKMLGARTRATGTCEWHFGKRTTCDHLARHPCEEQWTRINRGKHHVCLVRGRCVVDARQRVVRCLKGDLWGRWTKEKTDLSSWW